MATYSRDHPQNAPQTCRADPNSVLSDFSVDVPNSVHILLPFSQIDATNPYLRAGPVTDLQYEPEGTGATGGHQDRLQQQVERLRAYTSE